MAVRRLPALLGKLLFFITRNPRDRHLSLNLSSAILTELSFWSLFSSRGFTNLSKTIIFLSSPAVTPTSVIWNFVNVNVASALVGEISVRITKCSFGPFINRVYINAIFSTINLEILSLNSFAIL